MVKTNKKRSVNKVLVTVALSFCVIYTGIGVASQLIKPAHAFDSWNLERAIEDAISDKISAYDYDFKSAVKRVVNNSCTVSCDEYLGSIDCSISC